MRRRTLLNNWSNSSTVRVIDNMEYFSDALAQATYVSSSYVNVLPGAQDANHVKATTTYANPVFQPYFPTDTTKSLTGSADDSVSWTAANGVNTNQRFHIDLGSALVINRIYSEGFHHFGTNTNNGPQDFTFWGSNDAGAFADLTYATDTNWAPLTTATNKIPQHVALDQADPQYILVTNSVAYRYYSLKFANNWGGASLMQLRRIVLQSATLCPYTEASIKTQGNSSLKVVAAVTTSLNNTLVKTFSPSLNLTNCKYIKFDVRSSRIGANIKFKLHDTSGAITEITPNIVGVDTWQTVIWDISNLFFVRSSIDTLTITMVNADAENTFYIDNMYAVIRNSPPSLGSFSASGGVETTIGGDRVHTFTSDGTFVVTGTGVVKVLVVGGGGGGGGASAAGGFGGGGAGSVEYNPALIISGGTYTVSIGNGGVGGIGGTAPAKGANSTFGSITAYGGGGGETNDDVPTSGGSGGGGNSAPHAGAIAGSGSNVFGGGTGHAAPYGGGGGGGAATVGEDCGIIHAGNGGAGYLCTIYDSTNRYYGGGGAGGGYSSSPLPGGTGGIGGGGNGGESSSDIGGNGTPNTGGGGGGGGATGGSGASGGTGGSGIVIIRYTM